VRFPVGVRVRWAGAGLIVGVLFGPVPDPVERWQVETVVQPAAPMTWQDWQDVETPVLDSLFDVDEFERQSACLWEFMREHGLEVSVPVVMAAGEWTDLHGGACAMIGADDE
jgi:hypothetical protein